MQRSHSFTVASILLSLTAPIGCSSDSPESPATGTGGIPANGGVPSTGGASGTGGAPSSGGTPNSGGAGTGGAQATGGLAGTGGASGTCETAGTWGILFDVGVSWLKSGVLTCPNGPCSGRQQQRLLSTRTVNGGAVTDEARVCDVTIPKFSTIIGDIRVEFPGPTWDARPIVTTLLSMLQGTGAGATFASEDNGIVVGATLANPTTAPWPDFATVQATDDDGDGKPGVTALSPGQGTPTSGAGPNADKLYIAFRTVAQVSGKNDTCDKSSGTVMLKSVEQAILGCHIPPTSSPASPEAECNASQTKFMNSNAPKWTPDEDSKVTMVRLIAGTTCAQLRSTPF